VSIWVPSETLWNPFLRINIEATRQEWKEGISLHPCDVGLTIFTYEITAEKNKNDESESI
jgi:hypothetical protein